MKFMGGLSLKLFAVVLMIGLSLTQDEDYPVYSQEDLPQTSFTCKDKSHGGYYADPETDCQMYHICTRDKFGVMKSTKFLCGNGTVFDQRHQICQDYYKVKSCQNSARYYRRRASRFKHLEERQNAEEQYTEVLDYPAYSENFRPITRFTCEDKINGAFYADVDTNCQMYHICAKDKFGFLRSTRFFCGNGTVFDQRQLVCEDYKIVRWCKDSAKFYKQSRYSRK